MKQYLIYICILLGFLFTECEKSGGYMVSPQESFEALWKILNENYCFFEYKDVDWNEVHDRYKTQISDMMNQYVLFDVLGDMLNELEDRYANLVSTFDMSHYWSWYLDYPDDFNSDMQENYFGRSYPIAGGLKCTTLSDRQIGYIYYGSFSSSAGESGLSHIFYRSRGCKGLISDIRDSGGGMLPNADRIASRLLEKKILTGYIQHKTGEEYDDFSEPYPLYFSPSERIRWLRPVVVLTSRHCYSAANDFMQEARMMPYVTTVEDHTGDGSGFPFNFELLNGWGVRLSTSPMLDINKQYTGFSINPTYKAPMIQEGTKRGKDTIIEAAITHLLPEAEKKRGFAKETT